MEIFAELSMTTGVVKEVQFPEGDCLDVVVFVGFTKTFSPTYLGRLVGWLNANEAQRCWPTIKHGAAIPPLFVGLHKSVRQPTGVRIQLRIHFRAQGMPWRYLRYSQTPMAPETRNNASAKPVFSSGSISCRCRPRRTPGSVDVADEGAERKGQARTLVTPAVRLVMRYCDRQQSDQQAMQTVRA